jgi:uncharacterized protein YggE
MERMEAMTDTSGITVRGTGVAVRAPDLARVTLGVEVTEAGAADAQARASERMAAVIEAVRAAGVASRDVATARIALGPAWDYSGAAPRMTGYTASQSLAVRVRVLADLGSVIDAAVRAGATTVDSVALEVADPAAALAEARDAAMADAAAKAAALARAAGVSLGRAVSIREGFGGGGPVPMFKAARMEMAAGAPPVEAGEAELSVDLEVTFAILG